MLRWSLVRVQQLLDANPLAVGLRRETVEHPVGTMKARMGATHFLTKTLPKVAAEMALPVLTYNLTRAMNILGIRPLSPRSRAEAGPVLASRLMAPLGRFYTAKTTHYGH
jgi:hypothetical protein